MSLLHLVSHFLLTVFTFLVKFLVKLPAFSYIERLAIQINQARAPVDTDGGNRRQSRIAKISNDIRYAALYGPPITLEDSVSFIDAAQNMNGPGLDDRLFLLEHILTLMARQPPDSEMSARLQQYVINILYKDLPHPPSGYLSLTDTSSTETSNLDVNHPVRYAYRSVNGSNYNPLFPSIGKASSPYARSVPSVNITPPRSYPDAELVFDTLLKRERFEAHPGGLSSLFFAFADLIIHCIFNTDPIDGTKNNASSYLDLSVLYGSSDETVTALRVHDGKGKILDDVWMDGRLCLMPPSVGALLVIFNRNHNFVAERIFAINENGCYNDPSTLSEDKKREQDEEIFQRSRLVNSGFFMQVILADYVGAILGLVRDGLSWRLNPLETMRDLDHSFAPQGEGNVCSIEFNLLYRWHAAISQPDTKWTEDTFKELFPGKGFSEIAPEEFRGAVQLLSKNKDPDPKTWTFGGLERDSETNRFSDVDLANIIQNAIESPAAAFKARGTPEVLRVIEILGMQQARSWGVCSLNEFRKFMGLRPYATFKEWNPNDDIHTAAEALYHHIDNLELHVGLQAEEAKVPMAGAGLCPGYTISRAILADAVCLTRGDRFLTVDFTPFNLTSWGYQDCQVDKEDGSFGGMMTRLLYRHLPDYFPRQSAYGKFPFMVPGAMKKYLAKLDDSPVKKYSFTRPTMPKGFVVAESYLDVKKVLENGGTFADPRDARLKKIAPAALTLPREHVAKVLLSKQNLGRWGFYFGTATHSLIQYKSVDHIRSDKKYVDIVKDVINLVPVHWIANKIVGLSMKTERYSHGEHSEHDLCKLFADVSDYLFLNLDASQDWHLRENAEKAIKIAVEAATRNLKDLSSPVSLKAVSDSVIHAVTDLQNTSLLSGLTNTAVSLPVVGDGIALAMADANNKSDAFLRELLSENPHGSMNGLADILVTEVLGTAAIYSKALASIVDYYLDDERSEERARLIEIAVRGEPDDDRDIVVFARNALRLNPPVFGTYRTARTTTSLPSGARVPADQTVFASIVNGNRPGAQINGVVTGQLVNGHTDHFIDVFDMKYGLLSPGIFEKTIPPVLRAIFGLRNISRASGLSGHLNRFEEDLHGTRFTMYIDMEGHITPWPASLIVEYTQ